VRPLLHTIEEACYDAFKLCDSNVSEAARCLQVQRSTLRKHVVNYCSRTGKRCKIRLSQPRRAS
jgi:DNA-binding protein Fis